MELMTVSHQNIFHTKKRFTLAMDLLYCVYEKLVLNWKIIDHRKVHLALSIKILKWGLCSPSLDMATVLDVLVWSVSFKDRIFQEALVTFWSGTLSICTLTILLYSFPVLKVFLGGDVVGPEKVDTNFSNATYSLFWQSTLLLFFFLLRRLLFVP